VIQPGRPLTNDAVAARRNPEGLSSGLRRASVSQNNVAPRRFYAIGKRALDIGIAAIVLVLTLPLLALACALIFLTTRDSPVLGQRRVGRNGGQFTMYKLRTMRPCDTRAEPESEALDIVIGTKLYDDPRVTRVGHWLRRTSIDELPQLLNVLGGQMSLVGPRPGLPEEVKRYPRSWRRRLEVKPGLTGLWQVSGRSTIAPRRWMAMDRYYVTHRSFALDASILLQTVTAVVSMRGAW
jgi:lipopolysaccharide/colanic/teichoic acid biosynthesis glycosyltransferase